MPMTTIYIRLGTKYESTVGIYTNLYAHFLSRIFIYYRKMKTFATGQ